MVTCKNRIRTVGILEKVLEQAKVEAALFRAPWGGQGGTSRSGSDRAGVFVERRDPEFYMDLRIPHES